MNNEKNIAETDPVDRLLREKSPPSSGKGIAILALLVALAAVSDSAWRWWQQYRGEASDVTLQESMQRLSTSQQQMNQSLTAVQARVSELSSEVQSDEFAVQAEKMAALERTVGKLNGQSEEDKVALSAMQGSIRSEELRISAVEAGLINVAANASNSSGELDLAEIGFLLRAANERLQLFADPDAADLALQAADAQLVALKDPMYLSVRQRITGARQALSEIPRIDEIDLSSKITGMQAEIAALPFKGMAAAAPQAELPLDEGWWASLKNSLSSLVTVRKRVPQEDSLLSLEDKDYLRQGLWLQLESARLSLMRKDGKAYKLSLQRVSDTLNQYFENGSAPVQRLMQELASIQLLEVSPDMPDISGPWTQLQQLRDSRRLLGSAPAVESAPAQAAQNKSAQDRATQDRATQDRATQPQTSQVQNSQVQPVQDRPAQVQPTQAEPDIKESEPQSEPDNEGASASEDASVPDEVREV